MPESSDPMDENFPRVRPRGGEDQDPVPRRCTSTNRDGEQCYKSSMHGQAVCHIHGGKAPQNIRAAKKRLLQMSGVAMQRLQYAMENGDIGEQISASTKVLDRAGVGPNITVDLNDKTSGDLSHLSEEDLAARADEISAELRAARSETS